METATNLYSNLGNFLMAIGDDRGFMMYTEAAVKLRERYHLPENHDSFVQRANQAVAYVRNNERRKAEVIISELEKQARQIPNFGTTLGGLYVSLGVVELGKSPDMAKAYFIKAREAYGTHLSPEDEDLKRIADLIKNAEVAIRDKRKNDKIFMTLN